MVFQTAVHWTQLFSYIFFHKKRSNILFCKFSFILIKYPGFSALLGGGFQVKISSLSSFSPQIRLQSQSRHYCSITQCLDCFWCITFKDRPFELLVLYDNVEWAEQIEIKSAVGHQYISIHQTYKTPS